MTRGSTEIPKGLKRDWRKLAEAMREHKWTSEEGSRGVMAYAPDGQTAAMLHKTPSDWRAYRNEVAKFRRWCRGRNLEPGV